MTLLKMNEGVGGRMREGNNAETTRNGQNEKLSKVVLDAY